MSFDGIEFILSGNEERYERGTANEKKAMHIRFYMDASASCDASQSNVRSGLHASFN